MCKILSKELGGGIDIDTEVGLGTTAKFFVKYYCEQCTSTPKSRRPSIKKMNKQKTMQKRLGGDFDEESFMRQMAPDWKDTPNKVHFMDQLRRDLDLKVIAPESANFKRANSSKAGTGTFKTDSRHEMFTFGKLDSIKGGDFKRVSQTL